ncbi:MAG: OsmC family protein [Actinomycetota bacterium]
MHIKVKQVEGLSMVGRGDSNHWVALDAPKKVQGQEAASRPMELLLISLGGCLGMDMISLLGKKGIDLQGFEVEIEGQQAEEHPYVFTRIDVKCILSGKNLKEDDAGWAVEKARKNYCPVGAMLEEAAAINYSWEIV